MLLALLMCVPAWAENKLTESSDYQKGQEAVSAGNYSEGMRCFQLVLKDNPNNGYAWAWMSAIQFEIGENERAINAGKLALNLLPQQDAFFVGLVHNSLARAYNDMGEKDKALKEVTLCIQTNPDNMEYYLMRAEFYLQEDMYDKAQEDYRKIISVNPDDFMAQTGLGRCLSLEKRYDEAIEHFSKAIQIDGRISNLYVLRATCYVGKKSYWNAAKDYITAVKMDGNRHAVDAIKDCDDMCYRHLLTQLSERAEEDRGGFDWYQCIAIAHYGHGHYEEAIEYFQKSMDRFGKNAETYLLVAACYREMDNDNMARLYESMAERIDSK